MSEKNQNKFAFELGQLVVFKAFPPFEIKDNITKIGFDLCDKNIPVMIIHEMVHVPNLEKKFHEETGIQIASNSKYKCCWFSQKDSLFHLAWFYEDEIRNILENNGSLIELPKIGSVVIYKTYEIEKNKFINNPDKENETIRLKDFIPPRLCVKSIVIEKNSETFDQKKGVLINKKSGTLVKCVWFNNNSNKYSEELIPIESLMFA